MTAPRWFYVCLAIAALLFSASAAIRNLSDAGDRWTLHNYDGVLHAFNSRSGEVCRLSASRLCYNIVTGAVIDSRIAARRQVREALPAPDTGMQMMDSATMADTARR